MFLGPGVYLVGDIAEQVVAVAAFTPKRFDHSAQDGINDRLFAMLGPVVFEPIAESRLTLELLADLVEYDLGLGTFDGRELELCPVFIVEQVQAVGDRCHERRLAITSAHRDETFSKPPEVRVFVLPGEQVAGDELLPGLQ